MGIGGGTNDGKAYEELTEGVFRRLLEHETLVANVERDVRLRGRSTTHQIDVTFTFDAGGVEYRTIVQCKDWRTPVKQGQVLEFLGVLQDIPGQPRGIMVSRSGFQRGARSVADSHGVRLYELREPQDEDWEGLIRTVRIRGVIAIPEWEINDVRFDEQWFREELARRGIAVAGEARSFSGRAEAWFDESGLPVDIREVLAPLTPASATDWIPFSLEPKSALDVGGFQVDGLPEMRLRVLRIGGKVRMREHHEDWTVHLDHLVAYCFKDVLGGSVRFLDANQKPLGDELT